MEVGKFQARLLLDPDALEIIELSCWDSELTPQVMGARPVREWAEEHLRNMDFGELIRILLLQNVAATAVECGEQVEVVFEGILTGGYRGPSGYGEYYNEKLEARGIAWQRIPGAPPMTQEEAEAMIGQYARVVQNKMDPACPDPELAVLGEIDTRYDALKRPVPVDKTMRWLGFCQGWCVAKGIFSLDQVVEHSRNRTF